MKSPELELDDEGMLVVEAPTVEAALVAVRERCGPDAQIVKAEKVQSKGLGGFFSKQMFRVLVVNPDAKSPAPVEMPSTVPEAVDVVLRRVEAGESSASPTFGEALQAELSSRGKRHATAAEVATADPQLAALSFQLESFDDETIDVRDTHQNPTPPSAGLVMGYGAGTGTPPTPVPSPTVPSPTVSANPDRPNSAFVSGPRPGSASPLGRPTDEWAPGTGPICWSVDHLSRIGLPYRLIRELTDLDPFDDLAWVYRLAESAAPLCGAIPEQSLVLVGGDVSDAALRMGIDEVSYPQPPSYEGDIAISIPNSPEAGPYLQRIRAGRPLHLLCDDTTLTESLLTNSATAAAVSVVSSAPKLLAEALHVVVATGAVLGYFIGDEETVRITPFELALAVRARLPRE